jgi:hypothetical protein
MHASNNTFLDAETIYTIDHELNILANSLQRGNMDLLACIPLTIVHLCRTDDR